MGYRRRRSRNSFGSTVADSAAIANRLSPRGAFITGALGFTFFYFVLPWALIAWADHNKAKMTGDLVNCCEVINSHLTHGLGHPRDPRAFLAHQLKPKLSGFDVVVDFVQSLDEIAINFFLLSRQIGTPSN